MNSNKMSFMQMNSHPTQLKILVLTSGTGGGHNARANTFRQWVAHLYGGQAEVKIEHILENSSGITRFGVKVYNWIQRNAPILHNIYWWIAEIFGLLNSIFPSVGYRYYIHLLQNYQPQVIFSVHDSTNRGYF